MWAGHSSNTSDTELKIETAVLVYDFLPVVAFDIVYLTAVTNNGSESDKTEGVLSSFPSFVLEEGDVKRGWMTWSGNSELRLCSRFAN